MTSADEDTEKSKPSYTTDDANTSENSMTVSQKPRLIIKPSNSI